MEIDYEARYAKALDQIRDLQEDLRIANAKLEGDPCRIGQARESKIERQRYALKNLNRRVRIQRLQLRKLAELGRGMSAEEWTQFKDDHRAEFDDIYDGELVS